MSDSESVFESRVRPLYWEGGVDGHLMMLEQRDLPQAENWLRMTTAHQVADGIRDMTVRGAPAIGIAAAYGVALGFREDPSLIGNPDGTNALFEMLAKTRPTAVNLFWALERMRTKLADLQCRRELLLAWGQEGVFGALLEEAHAICEEDRQNNQEMGRQGAALLKDGVRILTHCNTGGLATGGYGTALGIIRAAKAVGKLAHVWVDETRPYLQGARLTAWECLKDELPATLITDSMAGYFMQQGKVDCVIVGTDRVAANGDVANKIGTYSLAVLCKYHKIPFFVAAPLSTIDLKTASGFQIPIEERSSAEVTQIQGKSIAPEGIQAAHPAFDVTPAELITAIITEVGVATAPYSESLPGLFR